MTDPVGVSDQQLTGQRCGYTVVDSDGIEQPCDRPAVGWRWYQDVEHEDMLDVACVLHENEGGRRMAALLAEVARLQAENEQLRGPGSWLGEAERAYSEDRHRIAAERDAALARLAAVEKLRDRYRDDDNRMAMVQGESPRPYDYSEGHYVGVRSKLRDVVRDLNAALSGTPGEADR